jgi:hypothetical protein
MSYLCIFSGLRGLNFVQQKLDPRQQITPNFEGGLDEVLLRHDV